MRPEVMARVIGIAILLLVAVLVAASGTYVVQPGYRGVEVILGRVSEGFKPEGFGLKLPLVSTIHPVSIRQQTARETAECYSSDLQQIRVNLRILYRIPESAVVRLFRDYEGDAFGQLVAPRVHEALKEVVALQNAEQIVKNREQIKVRTLELARSKIGELVMVEDLVIEDIKLTPELERAIEQKMIQEQEAAKAKFVQQRAQIEANTAVIKARGEAESIRIRGEALRENPSYVDLQIVDRWDGQAPLVVGGGQILMSVSELWRSSGTNHARTQSVLPARSR
ncbi:prohibitin family protein [Limisphaera ngatamarikiensis]|uniref:Prohibitin family protein n=1 Tax=Limisphaera ngatamarikiensis TaxID=1324935 RepID=A0A6M1RS16_9BACT|nr:prohibitin family protein [Limisphaera ngatamarikiensis]NGO38111.1 prohibitin family protein [Limisphaera ngatamarikiensis]